MIHENIDISGSLKVNGSIELNGSSIFNGLISGSSQIDFNSVSDNPFVSSSSAISASSHLVPTEHELYDLGSSTQRWRDLYLSGSTIDLGGTRISRDGDTGNIEFKDSLNNRKSIKVDEIVIGSGIHEVKLKSTAGVLDIRNINDSVQSGSFVDLSTDQNISGSKTFTGTLNIGSSSLEYNLNESVDSTTEVISSIQTGSHSSAFFDYVITDGSSLRAGTIISGWLGDVITYAETSTQDIGDTSDVYLEPILSGSNVNLQATTITDSWSIKTVSKLI